MLPMALRAWLSSRLKALIGTSSHTGSTATVERLLAGLVTSGLEPREVKPNAEPIERKKKKRKKEKERVYQNYKKKRLYSLWYHKNEL